jgi:hypothetical protein
MYSRLSRLEPLFFLPCSSSVVFTRLSGPRYNSSACIQKCRSNRRLTTSNGIERLKHVKTLGMIHDSRSHWAGSQSGLMAATVLHTESVITVTTSQLRETTKEWRGRGIVCLVWLQRRFSQTADRNWEVSWQDRYRAQIPSALTVSPYRAIFSLPSIKALGRHGLFCQTIFNRYSHLSCSFTVISVGFLRQFYPYIPTSPTKKGKEKQNYPRNRPWRPIGLWYVEVPILSRQSAHRWR